MSKANLKNKKPLDLLILIHVRPKSPLWDFENKFKLH